MTLDSLKLFVLWLWFYITLDESCDYVSESVQSLQSTTNSLQLFVLWLWFYITLDESCDYVSESVQTRLDSNPRLLRDMEISRNSSGPVHLVDRFLILKQETIKPLRAVAIFLSVRICNQVTALFIMAFNGFYLNIFISSE